MPLLTYDCDPLRGTELGGMVSIAGAAGVDFRFGLVPGTTTIGKPSRERTSFVPQHPAKIATTGKQQAKTTH